MRWAGIVMIHYGEGMYNRYIPRKEIDGGEIRRVVIDADWLADVSTDSSLVAGKGRRKAARAESAFERWQGENGETSREEDP